MRTCACTIYSMCRTAQWAFTCFSLRDMSRELGEKQHVAARTCVDKSRYLSGDQLDGCDVRVRAVLICKECCCCCCDRLNLAMLSSCLLRVDIDKDCTYTFVIGQPSMLLTCIRPPDTSVSTYTYENGSMLPSEPRLSRDRPLAIRVRANVANCQHHQINVRGGGISTEASTVSRVSRCIVDVH